jgi:PBP superfamily domain
MRLISGRRCVPGGWLADSIWGRCPFCCRWRWSGRQLPSARTEQRVRALPAALVVYFVIVARTTGSGTRATFDTKVLGRAEPPFSSYNCLTKDAAPDSPVIRCEVSDTGTLLARVNDIPGAIGYAQISDAATPPNVETIKLNGWDPTIGDVQQGAYPFWTVEYLYTYGNPAGGSLSTSFLNFLNTSTAKDIPRSQDYTPCMDRGESLLAPCAPRSCRLSALTSPTDVNLRIPAGDARVLLLSAALSLFSPIS